MSHKGDKVSAGPGRKTGAEVRKERLAQALRANLKRRKQAGDGRKDGKSGGKRDTGG